MDLGVVGLASDANSTVSAPVDQPAYDFTTGNQLVDPSTFTGPDLNAVLQPLSVPSVTTADTTGSSTSWSGLDELGSSVSNVASNIFKASGNLIAAQVNRTALLTATGRRGAALQGAQPVNPNAWHGWVLAAVVALGIGGVAYATMRR